MPPNTFIGHISSISSIYNEDDGHVKHFQVFSDVIKQA